MPNSLRTLCLVTLVLCNIHGSLEHEIPRRSFLSRRAIDGTRGRKYFDPEEEGTFDSYGSAGGQYDPFEERTDFSDIRRNVPGEPGLDYPAYTALPQTGFTCEGRSRGYYADVVAGCQVFHVCHDVLVSSFLCPVGSIFSQKLLTCDWWTKVDCSASEKYNDVNHNSYQQDDDEMIRNAYAMVSLQSGADVTEEGLVDPDRTGSIVDYQRGPGRALEFPRVDSIGNDLKNSFQDFANNAVRNFLPTYNQFKERKPETSRNYQDRYYTRDKPLSPYQNSPIIRVQKINDRGFQDQHKNRDFGEVLPKLNEFADRFQPSYAPTVPTVTTTTRRYYSPTVPTTYKPATPAYNKLDQLLGSSDFFFSHSRSNGFVTPPTIFPDEGKLLRTLERDTENLEGSSRKTNRENYEGNYEDTEETTRRSPKFQVRVPEFQLNRTGAQDERGSLFDEVYRGFEEGREIAEEIADDIETRGSIGLGHAFRGISIPHQNPVNEKSKGETDSEDTSSRSNIFQPFLRSRDGDAKEYENEKRKEEPNSESIPSSTPNILQLFFGSPERETKEYVNEKPKEEANSETVTSSRPSIFQQISNSREGEQKEYPHTLARPEPTISFEQKTEEATEQYQRNHQRHREGFNVADSLIEGPKGINVPVPSTTPSVLESTIKASTIRNEAINLFGDLRSHNTETTSESPNEKESIDRIDVGFHASRPIDYLKPPEKGHSTFQIKVPDLTEVSSLLTRYSTLSDEPYPGTRTTELPRFQSTYPDDYVDLSTSYDGTVGATNNYNSEETSKSSRSENYPTMVAKPLIPSIVPGHSSSLKSESKFPISDIFPPPKHHKTAQEDLSNKTDEKINYNEDSRIYFDIRDLVNPTRDAPKDLPQGPCSDESEEACKNSSSASGPLSGTSFVKGTNAVTLSPSVSHSSRSPAIIDTPDETATRRSNKETAKSLSTVTKAVNIDSSEATLKTVTHRSIDDSRERFKETESKGDPTESSTLSSILKSLRTDTLKHIEETIAKTNSPYQVTLTVNKDEELISQDDLIRKLITQRGKDTSTLSDDLHRLEIVKSVEPEVVSTGDAHPTVLNISETSFGHQTKEPNNFTTVEEREPSFNTVSLHQLMTELVKLDRAPRPFSRPNPQTSDSTTRSPQRAPSTVQSFQTSDVKDTSVVTKPGARATTKVAESSAESQTSTPLRNRILGQLTENFGEPLYKKDRYQALEPPDKDRILDFKTGLAVNDTSADESSTARTTVSTTIRTSTRAATTTTMAPTTILTTESTKTIVETEFIPSIGFSLDTDEGREEYVEAVLGGLTDSLPAETEKTETTVSKIEEKSFERNKTSGRD